MRVSLTRLSSCQTSPEGSPMRLTLLLLTLPAAASAQDWPQFRGPASAAVAPIKLDGKLQAAWKTPLADVGRGWSSPIVWKDRVYLTAVKNEKTPKSRPGLYIEGVF